MREANLILKVIKERRSVRAYSPEPVPEEDILKILDAARWAPSAGNLQPWRFIVVTDSKLKEDIAYAAYGQLWMATAPVIIVVCAVPEESSWRYGERGEKLYCIQDTAAAIQNILLAAHALGYGTCWVGAFSEDEVREILNIPKNVRPVALITIGKPAEKPYPPPRRELKEIVYLNRYGQPYIK